MPLAETNRNQDKILIGITNFRIDINMYLVTRRYITRSLMICSPHQIYFG